MSEVFYEVGFILVLVIGKVVLDYLEGIAE